MSSPARPRLSCHIPSFPFLTASFLEEKRPRCRVANCSRLEEREGCCGYHLQVSFLNRLRSRLQQHYGSTAQAAAYFQSLLGELSTFEDFCELLRFLRIPFKDEEAKAFVKEKQTAAGVLSVSAVFRDFLDTSPPHRQSVRIPPSDLSPPMHPQPPRVFLRSKSRPHIPISAAVDQSLMVTSSNFLSPSSSASFSPLPVSALQTVDRKTLYFVRDAVELLLRKGGGRVTILDFEGLMETFHPIPSPGEALKLFQRAENAAGEVTRESFARFWENMRNGAKGREIAELVKKLKTKYESFPEAFAAIAQGKSALTLLEVQSLAKSLGLTAPATLPLSVDKLSFQDFKTLWLENVMTVTQSYCAHPPCPVPVKPPAILCPTHSKELQTQGEAVWTTVKASIDPKRLVDAITDIKRERALKPDRLRAILSQYIHKASISNKDLRLLAQYFRQRLQKGEGLQIHMKRTSQSLTLEGRESESQDCSFYKKGRWTPTMAGMAGIPRSVVSSAESLHSTKSLTIQFPYPRSALRRTKPR